MPLVNKTFDQLLNFTRTTSGTFVGSNGLIQTTPASVNLLTYTQEFDNAAWAKTATTVTANSTVAPDGTSTADTLSEDSANSSHFITGPSAAFTSGVTYTYSVLAKFNGRFLRMFLPLSAFPTANRSATFNLQTGAVTADSGVTATATDAGNGYYRCSITVVANATASGGAGLSLSSTFATGLQTYAGDGTSGAFIWGAQLEAVPAANLVLGSELVTNGDFASGSTGWTLSGGWAIGSGQATLTAAGANAGLQQTGFPASVAGRTYVLTYTVVSNTLNGGLVRVGGFSGGSFFGSTITNLPVSVGPQTVSVYVTAPLGAGNVFDLWVTAAATSGTLVLDNVSLKEITGAVGMPSTYTRNNGGVFPPRFEYDPVTLAPKGLLSEEQRTNLVLRSEEFDNASWTKFQATVTANATVSPDGASDGDALVEDANTGSHLMQQFVSFTSGLAYTFSTYIKAGTRTWVSFGLPVAAFGAAQGGFYNLSGAGALGAAIGTPTARTITAVGNGWYRITVTATATATASGNAVIAAASADGSSSYTGVAGAEALYLYGAQIEAGAFATSYIPTVASQVTRTADQTSIIAPNFAPWFNPSEGTFVVEYSRYQNADAFGVVLETKPASTSTADRFAVAATSTADPRMQLYPNGSTVLDTTNAFGVLTVNTVIKAALAYRSGDSAATRNGASPSTSATAFATPAHTGLQIGSTDNGNYGPVTSTQLNGHIRSIRYFPVRLSNAQLQALTA